MVKHFNPSITQDAVRLFNLKGTDVFGSEMSPLVVATIPIQRQCLVKFGQCSNATATIMYTLPAGMQFYIIAANLNVIKDVTATSVASSIQITQGGVFQQLLARLICTPNIQYKKNI